MARPIDSGRQPKIGQPIAILLLTICTSVLLLTMGLFWYPRRDLQRTVIAPHPTSPETIAALMQLGARFRSDSAGRVWDVDIARLPLNDDDLAILKQLPKLQSLNLRGINEHGGDITNEGLNVLRGLRNLRRLNLSANRQLTDGALRHIRPLSKLRILNLSGTSVTNDGLQDLRKLQQLRTLTVPGRTECVTDEGLKHLSGSSIERLHGIDLHPEGIALAGGLTNLRRFPSTASSPRDTDLIHLRRLTRLESLRVHLSQGWADSSRLQNLKALVGLRRLELNGAPAAASHCDWSGLTVLGHLPNLKELRLTGVADNAVAALPPCESLQVLDLKDSLTDGSGIQDGRIFPELRVLTLNRFQVTNASLAGIRKLARLREVWLGTSFFPGSGYEYPDFGRAGSGDVRPVVQMTDKGLKQFKGIPNLRVLKLNGVPITDAGLFYLQGLDRLEQLELNGTQITDVGIMRLTELDRLRKLSFTGTSVSYKAATRLYLANPQCYIADNWCCGCMDFTPRRGTPKTP